VGYSIWSASGPLLIPRSLHAFALRQVKADSYDRGDEEALAAATTRS